MCEGQGGNGKGGPQIEVTPEMIEAGLKELNASGLLDNEAPEWVVEDIIRSGLAAAGFSCGKHPGRSGD